MQTSFLVFVILPFIARAQTISFLPPQAVATAGAHVVSGCPGCVAVADFNADGKPDIAFSIGTPLPFSSVLLGNGDGTFGTVVETDISADPVPAAMTATGDFNKDGKLDFVAGDSVYAGNGNGTFRVPVFFGPTARPCGSSS